MKLFKFIILFPIMAFHCLFLATSCENTDSKNKKEYKLPSKGSMSEIVIVMSKEKWNDTLGGAFRAVFEAPLTGIPTEETEYRLLQVIPEDFNRFLQRHHNVILVTSLDDDSQSGQRMKGLFTKESLETIRKDESKFMVAKSDEYAEGQKTLYLFGRNDFKIIDNLFKNQENIKEYFAQAERTRLQTRLYSNGNTEQTRLNQLIAEKSGLNIRIPLGYQVAKQDSNFMWFRFQGVPVDKSITITWGEYVSEKMFETENIVKWRNHFGYKSMNDTTLNQSYMSTQDDVIPLYSRKISADGNFAMEYKGMWKLKNNTRGGTFVGYAFVDEKRNRFYYIEGFVYAPNEPKKRPMLELEAILRTFRVGGKKS